MYHTVIPIHNLDVELQQPVQFGHGFRLGPLPEWVLRDSMLNDLNRLARERIADSRLAFVATYDANALGDPDPDWKEEKPRGIQEAKYEAGVMANLALWIAKPSLAGFTVVIHAPPHSSGPLVQRASTHSPLLCHPRHDPSEVTALDIDIAAQLHSGLVEIMKNGRDSSLWTVARSVWAGLQWRIRRLGALCSGLRWRLCSGPRTVAKSPIACRSVSASFWAVIGPRHASFS